MLAEALNTESVDWFTKKPLVLPEMWKTLSSRVTIYMVRRERDYAKVHQIAYQLTVRSGRVVGCHLHAADGVLLLLAEERVGLGERLQVEFDGERGLVDLALQQLILLEHLLLEVRLLQLHVLARLLVLLRGVQQLVEAENALGNVLRLLLRNKHHQRQRVAHQCHRPLDVLASSRRCVLIAHQVEKHALLDFFHLLERSHLVESNSARFGVHFKVEVGICGQTIKSDDSFSHRCSCIGGCHSNFNLFTVRSLNHDIVLYRLFCRLLTHIYRFD